MTKKIIVQKFEIQWINFLVAQEPIAAILYRMDSKVPFGLEIAGWLHQEKDSSPVYEEDDSLDKEPIFGARKNAATCMSAIKYGNTNPQDR